MDEVTQSHPGSRNPEPVTRNHTPAPLGPGTAGRTLELVKPWVWKALVAVGLVALAIALRGRKPAQPASGTAPRLFRRGPETPEATVTAFFDAASRGDPSAYLGLTTGGVRARLDGNRSELGPDGFKAEIQRSARDVKGLAVSRSADQPPEGVALDVELVFLDRNERQRFTLLPSGGGWLIAGITPAQTAKPAIPYGTPVFEE